MKKTTNGNQRQDTVEESLGGVSSTTPKLRRTYHCPKCGLNTHREPTCAGGGGDGGPGYTQFKCECGCLFEVIG